MIVECPSCHTRYRTDTAGPPDETTFFECTQADCGHVFPYSRPALETEQGPEPEAEASGYDPEEDSSHDPAQPPANDSSDDPPIMPAEPPIPTVDSLQSHEEWADSDAAATALDTITETDPTGTDQTEAGQGEEPLLGDFSSADAPFFDGTEQDEGRIELTPLTPSTPQEMVFSLKLFILVLGLVVSGYAAFTFLAFSYLETTAATLSRIPVLGPMLDAERPSARHIALTKMRGGFWLTKDKQRIFAIAGRAINQAGVPAHSIQIEGTLLHTNGKVLGQRMIFCGTETAPEVLESLTRREVNILQSLMPPRRFRIPAGEAVNFLITFTEPPSQIAEFSSRVIAAQFGQSY